ncbi:MAG: 3-phosphoshikimate 1-carboxyvinyltransferase [Elusimicrobiota bacterium]
MFASKKKVPHEIKAAALIHGTTRVTADKQISLRALIMTALSSGRSEIKNCFFSSDCERLIKILKKLGIRIKRNKDGDLDITGRGRYGLRAPYGKIDCGGSDDVISIMAGILVPQMFGSVLVADNDVTEMSMRKITLPLKRMGADISANKAEFPPLKIRPGLIKGTSLRTYLPGADVKTCLLFSALYSDETTTIAQQYMSHDHTERMMQYFGISVGSSGNTVSISGGANWPGKVVKVPGDFSVAAFLIAAALLVKDSSIEIRDVGLNPTRTGFLNILRRMGADIQVTQTEQICNEPVGTVKASYTNELRPVILDQDDIPELMDEIPLIVLLATRANGKTIIEGVDAMRKNRSNRLHAISTQLQNMGQSIEEQYDSLVITGGKGPLKRAKLKSFRDAEIAMMLTIAGLSAKDGIEIDSTACVEKSYPGFYGILEGVIER